MTFPCRERGNLYLIRAKQESLRQRKHHAGEGQANFPQVMLFYHSSNKDWGLFFLDPFVLSPITLTDLNKPEILHPKFPFSSIYFKSPQFHISVLWQLMGNIKSMHQAGRQRYLKTELTQDTDCFHWSFALQRWASRQPCYSTHLLVSRVSVFCVSTTHEYC